ncbi:hypothetical protein F442_21265 [Phytophthora nicotianae P10297]|uniref:Uncharacterized protein n=4 Tax=Phytophthora nicotianae TaxID=4792 RepID=W2QRT5_PHYN3|nr:hypothetical protein PPTG_06173 [Phytophthora nicotianae INRA-310]ETL78658.1 hypothetical protein L917_20569 [Phytophthora nicotianae]ETN15907.1 hypothetical protein PPTG_06173 [Phytophthora nicotianae INRA-310]ETP29600.1 hypothetical protein F442_21265 [Phytophthora nicotianae P10297]
MRFAAKFDSEGRGRLLTCVPLAMTPSDATFLADVEAFLASIDQTLPSLDIGEDEPARAEREHDTVEDKAPTKSATSKRWNKKTRVSHTIEEEKAKARVRRSAYVERQKVERETLRREVEKLTHQLEKEKTRVTSKWKMVAAHQHKQRANAEAEHRRLFAEIVAGAALIRELRGFLSRWSQYDSFETNELLHKRSRRETADIEVHRFYVVLLDGLYAQTNAVLRRCGLDAMDEDRVGSKQTWTRNTETGHFEYADKHIVPFEFEETCHSRWVVAHMLHRQQDRELHHRLEDSEHTVALKFRSTTHLEPGRVVSVVQRFVIRRYQEVGRMVIVWRGSIEGEGMFRDMHAEETGWGVATPFVGTSKAGTMLRTCVRITPMHFNYAPTHVPIAKQFIGLVLDSGVENNSEITNALENLLLRDE